jgi:hypothetical protein
VIIAMRLIDWQFILPLKLALGILPNLSYTDLFEYQVDLLLTQFQTFSP